MSSETLGNFIRRRRLELKLTQQQLAPKLNISQGYLTRLETDTQQPSREVLKSISDFFNAPYGILSEMIQVQEENPVVGSQEETTGGGLTEWLKSVAPEMSVWFDHEDFDQMSEAAKAGVLALLKSEYERRQREAQGR